MTHDARWCLYPWDVEGDPAAAEGIAITGAVGVALAAAYHSVRAATPRHPSHRVVDAARAAVYFPVRDAAWAGRRLIPAEGTAWAGADAYRRAAAAVAAVGLQVEPWLVLTHSSHLGARYPELCVTNAFGDVYPYALCPASAEVQEYAATIVAETVAATSPERIMIEACGALGFGHLGHHEKTAGAGWTAVDEALLSLCFCDSCIRALHEAGGDVARIRAEVRHGIGRGLTSVEEALGEHSALVREVRTRTRRVLAKEVDAVSRGTHLAMHVQPDPWATGPFAAAEGVADIADTAVIPGDIALNSPRETLDAVRRAARGQRIATYLNILPPVGADELASIITAVDFSDELYLYHYGLASDERIARSAVVLRG